MSKTKNLTLSLLSILVILFSALGLMGFVPQKAFAETRNLKVEDYTNSDYLLKSNGEESTKSIFDFAKEVKAAEDFTEIPELSQVIPVEYLDKDSEGTFAYNGLEYGFYMVKRDRFFDLLF